jgi:GDSL-like Lipase/Acylhydrolase family
MDAFRKFVSSYGLIISLLIAPPIFEKFFAMLYLFPGERVMLWIASLLLMSISLYGFFGRLRRTWVYFVLFNLLVLISVELGARSAVKLFFPNEEVGLARRANYTYDELRRFKGHPFLQFNGIPSTTGEIYRVLKPRGRGNQVTGNLSTFNNFGFIGRDFAYAKPPGVIRIAALGASTTADGYPAMLEEYLNARVAAQSNRFEVMNFAHAFYTSAHLLVNFVLNVIDFAPDYIIIHQAANDQHARASEAEFRGDYSHYLKVFQPPRIVDRYILRVSVPYRALKFYLNPNPEWMFVEAATQIRRKEPQRPLNARELGVFRRNIETIIDVASTRQIKVVLTTMPYSTDARYSHLEYMDQFNEVLKSIAANHDRLLFVDLDKLMTGKVNHLFLDWVHVNATGNRMKAEYIGKCISDDEERTLLKAP